MRGDAQITGRFREVSGRESRPNQLVTAVLGADRGRHLQLSASNATAEVNALRFGRYDGTSGDAAIEHAASVEGTLNLGIAVAGILGAALTAMGAMPLTGATLGAMLSDPAFPLSVAAALAVAPVSSLSPEVMAALTAALTATPAKTASATGQTRPGVGSRGLLIG